MKNDPFWSELTKPNTRHPRPITAAIVTEDLIEDPEHEEELDDSDVSLRDVMATTHNQPVPRKHRAAARPNGGLTTIADAEKLDQIPEPVEGGGTAGEEAAEEGKGKRNRKPNRLYNLAHFARHWDNEGSDVEN
jgi:hypothetical protein